MMMMTMIDGVRVRPPEAWMNLELNKDEQLKSTKNAGLVT